MRRMIRLRGSEESFVGTDMLRRLARTGLANVAVGSFDGYVLKRDVTK